jgi:hypothetical protein
VISLSSSRHSTGWPHADDNDRQWVTVATNSEYRSWMSINTSGPHPTSSSSDSPQPCYRKSLSKVTFIVKHEAEREIRLSLATSDATLAP